MNEEIEVGELVRCILVTGERATGLYSCTKETTGSHLIENVITDEGKMADYAWAKELIK